MMMNFKRVCCLIILINYCYITSTHCYQHKIARRAILFAENYVLQLTGCVTVPSTITNRNYFLNMCVQGNYMAISNASQFFPPGIIPASATRSLSYNGLDKNTFHELFISWMNGYGINGASCLNRIFCEISKTSIKETRDLNLIEKILLYVFTPTNNDMNFLLNNTVSYKRNHMDCQFEYPDCHVPVLDFVTNILL